MFTIISQAHSIIYYIIRNTAFVYIQDIYHVCYVDIYLLKILAFYPGTIILSKCVILFFQRDISSLKSCLNFTNVE